MFNPCDIHLGLQPLFIAGSRLFVRSEAAGCQALVVCPNGITIPLGELCSNEDFQRRHLRRSREWFRQSVEAAIAKRALGCLGLLGLVVDVLLPGIRARDFGTEFDTLGAASPIRPAVDSREANVDYNAIPPLELPATALNVYGRFWLLAEGVARRRQTHVWFGHRCLVPTGDYWSASTLSKQWQANLEAVAESIASKIMSAGTTAPESQAVIRASQAVREHGAFEEGDLVFINGQPPRLGCVIPAHQNQVVGAIGAKQYAITTTLRHPIPATVTDFQVYRRTAAHRWEPFQHNLCLGERGHFYIEHSPALANWAHLRWAAERIAINGRFHVNDGVPQAEENDYAQ
jgi:hypothetical protein